MAVLVFCEDNDRVQKIIEVAFRGSAHRVLQAPNGAAGFDLIVQEQPHLVISDVEMPVLDGMQLLDILKSRPDLQHIPVVFMTASVQQRQVQEGYRRGVAGFISKPFGPAELRDRIAEFLVG